MALADKSRRSDEPVADDSNRQLYESTQEHCRSASSARARLIGDYQGQPPAARGKNNVAIEDIQENGQRMISAYDAHQPDKLLRNNLDTDPDRHQAVEYSFSHDGRVTFKTVDLNSKQVVGGITQCRKDVVIHREPDGKAGGIRKEAGGNYKFFIPTAEDLKSLGAPVDAPKAVPPSDSPGKKAPPPAPRGKDNRKQLS